jgi:hypothetical protein
MARALHCPIFKHQPPRQSGCGLAQLFKDLSTSLGTGFGGKSRRGEDRPDALSTRGLREYAEEKNRHPEHTLAIDKKESL